MIASLPLPVQAGFWGLVSGSALVLGALIGFFTSVPTRVIAGIMAFGSGVLISALSFELIDEAYKSGGIGATALGFLGGATVYTLANYALAKSGAKHRKRSGEHQAKDNEDGGGGLAIAVGALLDGIPESIVIGLSLLGGAGVSMVAVIAVFLSNVPEGLSSSAGMKKSGRGAKYIFGVWGGIALVSGLASLLGYTLFGYYSPQIVSATTAVAAGAILAMLADTMMPEAFESAHDFAGILTVAGFLCAFMLSKSEESKAEKVAPPEKSAPRVQLEDKLASKRPHQPQPQIGRGS